MRRRRRRSIGVGGGRRIEKEEEFGDMLGYIYWKRREGMGLFGIVWDCLGLFGI
jgi:hypothetical protein